MKIKNMLLITSLATSSLLAQSGEELFSTYCAGCHHNVVGVNESGGKVTKIYEAPYAKEVIEKLKVETKTKEAFVIFVKDYIETPDTRKSLYGQKAIKSFGLMPSLKGVMSDEESTKLAEYLYSDYGKETTVKKVVPTALVETLTPSEKINEALFIKNCADCHTTVVGVDESGGKLTNVYEAPYAKDIMMKLKVETKTKEAFIRFVKDYIETPDKRKSLYGTKAIKDFGLMPSLQGVMSDEESTGLADYLYEKYTK